MTNDSSTVENAISDARDGKIAVADMLPVVLDGDLSVPSAAEVQADGTGYQPVLFDRQGTPMVAAFTSLDRIGNVKDMAPFALRMPAKAFFRWIPAGHGVAINPGQTVSFEIDPAGLQRLLQDAA